MADKITNLYNALVKSGYDMAPEEVFRERMKDPSKRRAAYDAMVKSGYNMRPFEEFETNIGYGKAQANSVPASAPQQGTEAKAQADAKASPASAVSQPQGAQSSASAAQPAWRPTEQDKIRAAYELTFGRDDYDSEGVRTHTGGTWDFRGQESRRAEKTRRVAKAMTREGRDLEKAGKMMASVSGTQTKVLGLTPNVGTGEESSLRPEHDGGGDESGGNGARSRKGAVPYGVVQVDGRRRTQWMLPDGTLTTDLTEADKAEYGARSARLMDQFVGRMKANGLDPAKQEDVQKQVQLDYEAPIRAAVAAALQADDERSADEEQAYMSNPLNMVGGVSAALGHAAARKQAGIGDLGKIAENAYNTLPSAYRRELTASYADYFKQHPEQTHGKTIAQAAEDAARSEVYRQVHEEYVKRNGPQSKNEFFLRKILELNPASVALSSTVIPKGQASAELEAMDRYGAEHKGLSIAGTVVGMAIDPTTYLGGWAGNAAFKYATRAAGKLMARKAIGDVVGRYVGTRLAGRLIGGVAAGAANLGTFEGVKDVERQLYQGGYLNPETGEMEGFSIRSALSSGVHGVGMGAAIGVVSPLLGNVADKWVKATESTAGKMALRAGEEVTSKLLEGTIFAVPDIYTAQRMPDAQFDQLYAREYGYDHITDEEKRAEARKKARGAVSQDAWNESMAMMMGFGLSHVVKTAPSVIRSLRPVKPSKGRPLTRAERVHNNKSFVEHLRERLDHSPSDLAMTAEEREELRQAGYGELSSLFAYDPKYKSGKGGVRKNGDHISVDLSGETGIGSLPEGTGNPTFDGYEAMEKLMEDTGVSEATRAKAYYILTGRSLPASAVTGWTREAGEDGSVTISSLNNEGEKVTSRRFKDSRKAQREIDRIKRQVELNTIDIGEQTREAEALQRVFEAAVEEVLPGADPRHVYGIYEAAKLGSETLTEEQRELAASIDEAIVRNAKAGDDVLPERIRERISKETGVEIDKAIRKEPGKRTEAEQEAVERYGRELFPELEAVEAAEGESTGRSEAALAGEGNSESGESAEGDGADNAGSIYEGGRDLYGRYEEGDPEAQAEVDAIVIRMQEAEQIFEDAFGAESEYYRYRLGENPWGLVNDPDLTVEQQDAVLYYINAKAALDGVKDASSEAAERKRAEVEQSVSKRIHKDSGAITPATMKVDDREVYIVKGDVRMFPDGSGVDVHNSSESVIVMDAESGEYEFTSPEQILKVGESIDPQTELRAAFEAIDREQEAFVGTSAEGRPQAGSAGDGAEEGGSSSLRSEHDGTDDGDTGKSGMTGGGAEAGTAQGIANVEEYDKGYKEGLQVASTLKDETLNSVIEDLRNWDRLSDEWRGRLDAYEYEQQLREQERRPEPDPNVGLEGPQTAGDVQWEELNKSDRNAGKNPYQVVRDMLSSKGMLGDGQVLELIVKNSDDANDGGHITDLQAKVVRRRVKHALNKENRTITDIHDAIVNKTTSKTKVNVNGLSFLYKLLDRYNNGEISEQEYLDVVESMFYLSEDAKNAPEHQEWAERLGAATEQATEESALSRIPVDEESGEKMFEAVDKELAWDGLVEAVGSDKDAADIAQAQIEQASTELEALKKKPPTLKAPKLKGSPMAMAKAKQDAQAKYDQEVADYNQRLADTQARVGAWTSILGVHQNRAAEARRAQEEERRKQDAEAHAAAVAQFEEEQRVKAEKHAEQEAIGTHAVNPKIREKWDTANKVEGHADAITLPDGSTLRGRYVLTEAGAATASHDANNGYAPTEGFPVDANGQSVNDRDYQGDKDAQRIVEQMGAAYDNRALQTPVIVSKEGVVLSGNNRTMSGDLAARQGTDKAYTDYLREFGAKYGFTPEQVKGMEHPRVVFVPDEDLPYDATTFARFNAQEMKSQSKPEAAIKLGKIVDDATFNRIVGILNRYDRLSDFYADQEAAARVLGELAGAGVINDKQMPEMRTGTALSAAGKELIENTLIGKVFQGDPEAVRMIISMPALRQSVILGLNEIAKSHTLGAKGYDLGAELTAAIDLVYRARMSAPDVYKDGMPVSPYGRMQGLFDDEFGESMVTDGTTLLLADVLNSGKPSELRKILALYNKEAGEAAAGGVSLFNADARPETKEEILTTVNKIFNDADPREKQRMVDDAIAARKHGAEQEAGGGGAGLEQAEDSGERGAGREERAGGAVAAGVARGQRIDLSPTDAQKEAEAGVEAGASQRQFDRTVPSTPGEQKSAIARIVDFAKRVKDRVERAVIGGITARQKRDFAEQGIEGIDDTWVHSFESSAVSHNQSHHGNANVEDRVGQIAISEEDYARIPEILDSYDRVTKSPNRSRSTGNEVVIYEKEFEDGYVYYLEEKRDRRKSLSFQTMYKKKKGTDSSDGLMPTASPSTPVAPSDNLSSNSDGKGSALPGDMQEKGSETGKVLLSGETRNGRRYDVVVAKDETREGVRKIKFETRLDNGDPGRVANSLTLPISMIESDNRAFDVAEGGLSVIGVIVDSSGNVRAELTDGRKVDVNDLPEGIAQKLGISVKGEHRESVLTEAEIVEYEGHVRSKLEQYVNNGMRKKAAIRMLRGEIDAHEAVYVAAGYTAEEARVKATKLAEDLIEKLEPRQVGRFKIYIENERGSVRSGVDSDDHVWETEMRNDYGFISGAKGTDGDNIDVFLSEDMDGWEGRKVFVVDQYKPDGSFDEHKVMLGFQDRDEAFSAYLANYESGWEKGRRLDCTEVAVEDFEKWIESSKRKTKPFAEYRDIKRAEEAALAAPGNGESVQGYTITAKTYARKSGKGGETPVWVVRFERELTAEEKRALVDYIKKPLSEGKKTSRGWVDRESGDFFMRSEEAARGLGELLGDEEAVADAQPLSVEDLRAAAFEAEAGDLEAGATGHDAELGELHAERAADAEGREAELDAIGESWHRGDGESSLRSDHDGEAGAFAPAKGSASRPAKEKPKKAPVNRVSLEDVMSGLYEKGETRLDEQSEPLSTGEETPAKAESSKKEREAPVKGQFKVTEEMKAQEDELRRLLGIDDEEGSRDVYFRDPDDLTPEEKRKVFALGVNYAFNFLDNGVTAFPDFARAVVMRLGGKVKPFLKSWYEGAKRIPGYGGEGYTDSPEVDRFDIENFDKPNYDAIKDAEMRVAERKAREAAEQAERELKETRNRQRKENDKQREADTAALGEKADAVAKQAETDAKSAGTGRKTILRTIEKVDETIEEINDQLALLGYYEADLDSPEHEVYGLRRSAEKKAVKDAVRLARQLVDDLGIEIGNVSGKTTEQQQKSRGKGDTAVRANISSVGGDISVNLPYPDGRDLHIYIGLTPTHERGLEPNRGGGSWEGDNYEVESIMFRFGDGHNHFLPTDVTYGKMLSEIQKAGKRGESKKEKDAPFAEAQGDDKKAYHGTVTLKDGREAVVIMANHTQDIGETERLTDYIVGVKGEPVTIKVKPEEIAHAGAPTAEDKPKSAQTNPDAKDSEAVSKWLEDNSAAIWKGVDAIMLDARHDENLLNTFRADNTERVQESVVGEFVDGWLSDRLEAMMEEHPATVKAWYDYGQRGLMADVIAERMGGIVAEEKAKAKAEESHNGYKRGDEVMWDRNGNGKWEKQTIVDFEKDGSPIFDSMGMGMMMEKGDWSRIKPADGVFGEAKRVATEAQAERKEKEKRKQQSASSRDGQDFRSPVEPSLRSGHDGDGEAANGGKGMKTRKKDVTLGADEPVGGLFANLNEEPKESNGHEKETDIRAGAGVAGRAGGHEPRQDAPLGAGARNEDEGADGGGMAGRGGGDPMPYTRRGPSVSPVSSAHGIGTAEGPFRRLPASERRNRRNHSIKRGSEIAPAGVDARIRANIAAIETMKRVAATGEEATAEEMATMRAFSGWGGLGKAFSDWSTSRRLRELLGEEAFAEDAQMSRNSAYFTPGYVVDAMWDVAKALGFRGGKVLEGSAGIGNILGLMPGELSDRSEIHAVEKDSTTGTMLGMLYPDAKVDVRGFEETRIPNGSVDLAITNVPFVPGLRVKDTTGDADLSKRFKDIHNFCIAKNVRKLRDGGIGIFITTKGTLDGTGGLYKWLTGEGNADIVGLFRLHNETFGGTDATSDIIVVRKRVNGRKSPYAIDAGTTTGVRRATYTDKEGKQSVKSLSYNRYYVEHPEHMAGEMKFGFETGNTYRPTSVALQPAKGKDQGRLLKAWVREMSGKAFEEPDGTEMPTNHREEYAPTYDKAGVEVKTGTMVVDSQGRVCVNYDGELRPLMSDQDKKNPKSREERIAQFNRNRVKGRTRAQVIGDYNEVKKALADLLDYQKENEGDEGLRPYLDRLNEAYDRFVGKYGHLHGNRVLPWLRNDVDYPSVLGLETYREEGLEHTPVFGKADIFRGRVLEKKETPKPESVKDGVILSIREGGDIDTRYIAEALGRSEEEVRKEIIAQGLGYENPASGRIEPAHLYLSGNVREKLRMAESNNDGGRYETNIAALRRVVPASIPAHMIEFNLGSSWLKPELFKEYIKDRTDTDVELAYGAGTWDYKVRSPFVGEKDKSFGVASEMCDKIIPGHELIMAAMTNRTIRVSRQTKETTVTDQKATQACASRVDEIRDDFKGWLRGKMQQDQALATEIEESYNDIFNNSAPVEIPGEYVPEHFEGAATVVNGKELKLRPHQAKAVVKGTTQSLMLAHEVGTGKTYTLITTAMEMRRLGTAKKPMIVVQNSTLGQFVASAKALYPDARILSIEDKDRNAQGRKDFYAKIRYNDWDMVVIPQSVLEKIDDHPDRKRRFIQEAIEEKMEIMRQLAEERDNFRIVSAMKKEIEKLEGDLAALPGQPGDTAPETVTKKGGKTDEKKEAVAKANAKVRAQEMLDRETDDMLNFDDLGVDALLVDEAHEYKHLGFATAMQRGVKGVDPSYSKKSQGLFLKVKAIQERTGGRNVVFATGTPISNTAAEIWTFMRYLMPKEEMQAYNIYYFDDFVRNFGSIQQMLEFGPSGKYKEVNRFAGYNNLPELGRIWAGIADTVLTAEAGEVKEHIPELEGGQPTDIYLPQSSGLRAVLKYVRGVLEKYEKMSGQEKKENSHIPLTMYGIAKAAAVDARLVSASAPDDPHSKTNEAVRQTLRSLKDTEKYRGTVAIFADNYQRKNRETGKVEFNLFEDIKKKLIEQGVPEEQICIMNSNMSAKKKEQVFSQVNRGEIRVIMGTTPLLGVGVNIQERLHTLMHLDAPNRPMDYWQRMGRLLRQGNLHKEMGIPVRVLRFGVEDSLDVTAYQRLKTKGAIADAVMNSKALLANNLENRVLEEEGDEFGAITAQLSGSEYAILLNQAEKELRKLLAKEESHRTHQTYIHHKIPEYQRRIESDRKKVERLQTSIDLLESLPEEKTITLDGKELKGKDALEKAYERDNQILKVLVERAKTLGTESEHTVRFKIAGEIEGEIRRRVQLIQRTAYGEMEAAVETKVTVPGMLREVGLRNRWLKGGMNEVLGLLTPERFARHRDEALSEIAECEKGIETLRKDEGKPFEGKARIDELRRHVEEYTELLQADLEAKERKYAEMDKEVGELEDITFTSEEEDTEGTGVGSSLRSEHDVARYRDGEEMTDGERMRAIRALEPIEVERNELSREELREIYDGLPSVEKDGREIEFYRSAFKKIYKEGGLFGQVVPVLDEVLEQSVLAYSEVDNLGGTVRPDGTVHKEHKNIETFDNYVGKVRIEGKEYYVRTTVQNGKRDTGTHSFFVSSVEVYEKPTESRTIPITSRGTTDFDGISDAKLAKFFERASAEAERIDMRERVERLSEKLNSPIRVITKRSELEATSEDGKPRYSRRERRAKGWWDPRTGEVVVVLPNNVNVADVENTVVHELVGHKGLRAFIGEERFERFLGEVYDHTSNPIRKQIDKATHRMVSEEADRIREQKRKAHERAGEDYNSTYYSDMAEARLEAEKRREDLRREATEEYMADLAGRIGDEGFESMSREELTLWGKIKAKVQGFLDRFLKGLGISKGMRLTDKDLSYILYRSWKNARGGKTSLRSGHNSRGPIAEAEDAVRRYNSGWDAGLDKKLKDEGTMERVNRRFNAELEQHIEGRLPEGHIYSLGRPGEALRSTGVPDLPIQLSARRLRQKATEYGHDFDLREIRNLVKELQTPMAVFSYGNKGKMQNIIIGIESNGKQFIVGLSLNPVVNGKALEINSVRNVFPKNNAEWLNWISQGKLLYADKQKIQALIDKQRTILADVDYLDLEDVAKIVDNFENPKYDEEQAMRFRDGGMGLEETLTRMKAEAMAANVEDREARREAMRAIGGNLRHLRSAMARQREYDVSTVKSVSDLARVLMDAGLLDDLSKYETKRILGAIDNVVGKQDVSRYVQRVMDIMVENQLRLGANAFGRLLQIRGSRVDARGIEVQGELDPEGRRIAQVVRNSTTLPKDDIDNRMAEAMNRMSSTDQATAEEAAIEYAGLSIARQYVEEITESKAEEKALRKSIKQAKEDKDAGQLTDAAYRQLVAATEDAIRQNKIERAESFHSLAGLLGGVLKDSIERAREWREGEKRRVAEIHHNANSDMEGRATDEHHKESRAQKIANNSAVRFLMAPLATFDQMLRMFGGKSVRGEGYLWNRYMRGWVEATEREYTGYRDSLKELDAKVSEVFGKKMTWGDLFGIDRKLPKASVKFWDGGEMKEHELTQGNLLYIYMADKMSDGRMKLRRMGITEEDVEEITNFLDPRFIELADWMQEEFLVEKRNEYDEVHKRMFGASMAAIENYFPLKILANARLENVDVADDRDDTALPATTTGSIIKRRRNDLALDVTGANAFSVILDHLQQMERWAAFAEFNRDLNTLLSYKRFRNQVMNMTSAYGAGKTLWKNFRNVAALAAGAYRPPVAALDKWAVNIAKGVTAAKVSFRMFTALKQLLSMPAYASDSNPIYLAESILSPDEAWLWSMENLPLFEKRWKSRMAGDPRLLKSEMDWKMWRSRVVEIAGRVGMSPNAFVDALTVAIGAHSIYRTKLAKYRRWGMDEEAAEKRAKQDATILFNQTQQSSEGAFLSTMQVDRSWLSVLFTVFRNSSMSYTRQLYDALRNLGHRMVPGYKGLTEEFMAKQMVRDGIDPDTAGREAKREYRRGILRDLVRVGIFGYGLQLAWNLGAYLPYMIFGDDEQTKEEFWQDVWRHTMFGSIEGLTGGDVISAALNMLVGGEGYESSLEKHMPITSDITKISNELYEYCKSDGANGDMVGAMNDVINLLVQSGLGVNPQSLTDAAVAVMDFCGDDSQSARECALLITRILNCPQSQIDKIYFDELGASGAEARRMTPQEIAERYARYKVRRGAPLTGWAYGDEAREKLMDKYRDRSNRLAKERLGRETDREAERDVLTSLGPQYGMMRDAMAEYEATEARVSEIKKEMSRDEDRYYELLDELESTPEFGRYLIVGDYKREVERLTKEWLRAGSAEERDSCARAMTALKRDMLKDLREAQ